MQPIGESTSDVRALLNWTFEASCALSADDCLLRPASFNNAEVSQCNHVITLLCLELEI